MNLEPTTYIPSQCAVFRKTKEAFGGLSNMAGGYPLVVNGISIRTTEALYQALRFPHLPEVQQEIIDHKSPMSAKWCAKAHINEGQSRSDWDDVRVPFMMWCLCVKLVQNPSTFVGLLESTGNMDIVEFSLKDAFWGAKPVSGMEALNGVNILGQLLMQLRDRVRSSGIPNVVQQLNISGFLLGGKPIEPVVFVGSHPASGVVDVTDLLTIS